MFETATLGYSLACLGIITSSSEASRDTKPFPVKHGKIASKDAGPVGMGQQEIELVMTHRRAGSAWDGNRHRADRAYAESTALSVGYGRGIARDRDLEVAFDYRWLLDRKGGGLKDNDLGDAGISSRWRFLNKDGGAMQAAWATGLTFSTGPSATGQGYTSWDNNLIFSKDFGRWAVLANVKGILAVDRGDEDPFGQLRLNLALGYQAARWIQPEMELNYIHEFLPQSQYSEGLRLTSGFVITPNKSYRVDLGVQQSIYGKGVKRDTSFIIKVKCYF